MKVEGAYEFEATRETVFPMLRDRDILLAILPGCERLESIGDDRFEGIINIKVGPVQGRFNGEVIFSDMEEPERGKIVVKGQGAPGFVNGTGAFHLEPGGHGCTLRYTGDAQIGGRLAAVGQRLLDTSARAIIQSGLEGLDERVRSADEGESAADEPSIPEQRSQADFAAGVAKHIVKDVLEDPEQRAKFRNAGIGLGVVLLAWVLYRILSPSRKRAS
jgi:carbon monoxide dehydrogenase subunit G